MHHPSVGLGVEVGVRQQWAGGKTVFVRTLTVTMAEFAHDLFTCARIKVKQPASPPI